ncbi:hypothetical protein HF888_06225 [Bermanella marisrubri]|uniref:Chalcone isomerase domain-containing protein n=1 Tax=Bermanella marisrubri TaxID=207949 RepID=Q1N0M3_9GAMM|nr:chalcone isomerase family protein [Bermanella marisrubri]EAT11810.1 hypothetical protein RED65_05469 [Oceanobacter sp. RED65] [Bermanella marisrubri]QIZ83844.1 hypothetical protein HF888_06225 [Bermanella marisrubri]
MNLIAPLIAIILLVSSTFTNASTVAGIEIPDRVPATSERPELVLNGASLRELYLLIDTYVGALYLETPSHDPEFIMDSAMHKRMVFHVKMRKVSARRIANALTEALVVNITPAQHKELTDELEQMLSYFTGDLYEGDQSIFDYSPGKGTKVIVNDNVMGTIQGDDYFKAMLAIWIGENPVGREFKQDVLGLSGTKIQEAVAGQ